MTEKEFTDRRTFIKATGAASTGLLLSGCTGGGGGGGDDGNGGATKTTTPYPGNATLRNQLGLPELDYSLEDGPLNVFQWSAYWPRSKDVFRTIKTFEEAYGVTVNVSNYASNEEMFNKLKAGGTGQFDLIFPSDYMVNILANQGMIQKINLDRIPNFDNMEKFWVENAPYDPDPGRYSVPYFWGTSGVAWNANMFSKSVQNELPFTSWDALWDERFAGQMTMLNDMRETIGASLKRLGYSLNSKKESQIQEAKEALIKQKDLLQTYTSTGMAEMLINKNASPIHTWSGSPFQAYWELYEDGSSPVGYRVPEEGSVVWVDTSCVTKKAKHPKLAHAFINFLHNPRVHANIANWVYYPSPNEAAKQYIYDSMLQNDRIYPPEETFKKLEFIRNLGDATKMWSEAWTEIQNA